MWNALRPRLEASHRMLVPDLPGHGRSGHEPYVSHARTVAELAKLTRETVPHRPVAVVGFSLGAQLALQLASEYPELVNRTVVISAQAKAMPFTGLALHALSIGAPLARQRWFAKLQARELFIPPSLMEDYITTSRDLTRESMLTAVGHNMRFQIPPGWSTFSGSSLVMVGQNERSLMRDSAVAIHKARPAGELEIVRNAGHGIPLQRPEWFNDRLLAWLDSTEEARSRS